jgi:hypothetical protein
MRTPPREIHLLISKHRAFGPAICWLGFYALAVVSAAVANFNQVIKVVLATLR